MLSKVTATLSVLALTAAITMPYAQAGDIQNPEVKLPLSQLSEQQLQQFEQLMSRHSSDFVKNQVCPMNSSKYSDILTKIDNIKALFRNTDCAQDPTELDKILNGLEDAKVGLKEAAETAGTDTSSTTLSTGTVTVGNTELDGKKVADAMNNINNLFFKSKCNFNKGTILERGADVIQNFAQLGLLVPNQNGLLVAGGGLALSSLLRMINSLFEKKFDFSDNNERKSFIKLNCAFYDIRKEIGNSGMLDIALPEHKNDQKQIETLIKQVDERLKKNKENYDNILKSLAEIQATDVKKALGILAELQASVESAKNAVGPEAQNETDKMNSILKLLEVNTKMAAQIEVYLTLDIERQKAFDTLLGANLQTLKDPTRLIQMSAKDYNAGFRAIMLAHLQRIEGDIALEKSKLEKKWETESRIDGNTVANYKKALEEKFKNISKDIMEKKGKLTPVNTRLETIINGDTHYTMTDDGDDNKTAILSSYDEIAIQVYGKWGFIFLDDMSNSSIETNDEFRGKFRKFAENFLKVTEKDGVKVYNVLSKEELIKIHPGKDLAPMFACQDARPFRRLWVEADSYSQNAFDFLATNKDLFHSDIPRVFLGTSGGRVGIHGGHSKFEHIQRHHKSTIYAKRALNMKGEELAEYLKDKKKYLVIGPRKKYTGMTMLDINETRPMVEALQRVVDQYECKKLAGNDDI